MRSTGLAKVMVGISIVLVSLLCCAPVVQAQGQSGFIYNGINLTSYQADEYSNSSEAATTLRATGANYAGLIVTQYVQTSTSDVIAPETTQTPGYVSSMDALTPSDAALISAIQSLASQGLIVSLKPQVDSVDQVFRGDFAPTDVAAWFASYQTFILHYAQIASQNNVGMLVIGTELKSLSGAAYKSYWEAIISQIRVQYPDLTLTYAANAVGAGDEFSTVSFWADLDIIGVDGYVPLTNMKDPTVAELVAAWTNNLYGFNAVAVFKSLQSTYGKPLIFTEIGYVSVSGTNEIPYSILSGPYDGNEQQNCYEAFFEVFSQQTSWMKGVFWWNWNVSPPAANDTLYTAQTKPAGVVTLPKWFGSATPGFTIAPTRSTLQIAQSGSATDAIAVTAQGGFTSAVTFSITGLPTGVTGSFSSTGVTGTQLLTLSASSMATASGPTVVTITGVSGSLTASTAVSLSVSVPPGFTISGPAISLTGGATTGNTSLISLTPTGGFTGVISLTCSISPVAASSPATCSLSPQSVTIAGTAMQTSSLTVATKAVSRAENHRPRIWGGASLGATWAVFLIIISPQRRRRFAALSSLSFCLCLVMGGCGGAKSSSDGGSPGTSSGNYTVTVMGMSGAISSSGVIALTVQ